MNRLLQSLSSREPWLALIAGGVLPLAFAPVGWFPLAVLSPALLFWLWRDAAPGRAAWLGWLFGLGQFGVGVSWVYVAIHDFGHTPAPLAGLLTAIFVVVLALYPALVGWVGRRFGAGLPPSAALLLWWPALWVWGEWLRSTLLGGFPWLNLGYAQIDTPLVGYAPVVGVFGLGWLAAFTAGALVYATGAARRPLPRVLPLLLAAMLWLGGVSLAGGAWTTPVGDPIDVALVQGNVPQDTKWDPAAIDRRLNRYAELSLARFGSVDLVVWPENAVTVFYHQLKEHYFDWLEDEARQAGTDLLLGVPVLADDGERYYTGIMSLGRETQFYFKRHLVPFGEYVPLEDVLRGLIGFFDLPMSRFLPGPPAQPPLPAAGVRAATSVCYEDAFGAAVAESLDGAELLVNGSNNAWYGDSLAPHQHLQISRMRAVETGRPMLRATTNGISAVIDPFGRIIGRSPQFETYVLTATVQPMQGATPYVRFGDWPVLIGLAALVAAAAGLRRRKA